MASEQIFDNILIHIGNNGPFQKKFNFIFNFAMCFLASMPYLNFIISLTIPNHWCAVPGREKTNYTLEEWKLLTIPKNYNSKGVWTFDKCKMYNVSYEDGFLNVNGSNSQVDCQHGWEYDTEYYSRTAASQENWVCTKDTYVTNTFVMSKIGDLIGMFVFGQLGDIIGRKPVFFISLICLIFGRCMSAFTAGYFPLFLAAALIGSLSSTAIFQSPLVISMEISASKDAAYIAMLQCLSWTISLCIMPFIMWFVRDWFLFMLITTLPSAIFLFSGRWIIESPKWLADRGKIPRAIKELRKIAKVNHTQLPDDLILSLKKLAERKEKVYGVMSLFTSWRLAKNTLLLLTGWMITTLVYNTLTLNISNLDGNPFVNYFWQSLAELPGYVLGKYMCNVIGRRWTYVFAFLVTSLTCVPVIILILIPGYEIWVSAIAIFIKFSISFSWYAVNLQALETYPTCIKQTGVSLGHVIANGFGIFGPYIVYWGISKNATVPFVISGVLCICGAICGLFLPETLNQKLPETLADAHLFGADQPFCYKPWKKADKK